MHPTVSETNVRIRGRSATVVAAGLTAVLALAACGSGSSGAGSGGGATTLTLYNAQHEDLMKLMVAGFTKETGIKVNMRNGEDFELANQLVQEGKASPADVFVTENSPAMTLVDGAKGFTKVDAAALNQVPSQFAPKDGNWVGFAARSTVLAYNKTQLKPAQLPVSILDLAKPQWKGKIGIASAGADFQAIVSAVVALEGEAKAEQWLKGLKENAKVYRGNNAVMQAVDKGEIQAGVIYHYYWFKDQAESGDNSNNTSLHYFGNKDPGAFLSVSGAGVLATSKHQKQAQQLVTFLNGPEGQKILADSAAMEYPIGKGATANKALKPLTQLDPPTVEVSTLNGSKVVELMQQAGLL
jgi:iron(III) transport system substrate-binding protein